MKLKNVLIVTNDIERSRKFYHDLFGLASWLLWQMSGSAVLLIGGVICFAAGMLKVLWKFIVVLRKKMSGRCLCRCESECRWGFGLTTCSL